MKSVSDVAKIEDPMERLTAAANLVRTAEARVERLRSRRDLAILTMLRPFADAVAPTNAVRAQLRAKVNAGELDDEQYIAALGENREQRRADIEAANVTITPVDVYEMLGVSRNLVNRLLMRMPDAPLPDVANPKRAAKAAHAKIPEWECVIEEARAIRDATARMVMSGEDDDGREFTPVSNADVARATGLTTARIAQLRESA